MPNFHNNVITNLCNDAKYRTKNKPLPNDQKIVLNRIKTCE